MSPEEVAQAVAEVRDRVRERHKKTVSDIVDFELPPLDPLGKARDVADAKSAAIGQVNPRPKGLLNDAVQAFKKTVARGLGWFVRDQVEYNRAVVAYMDRNLEAMIEQNHNIRRVALEFSAHRMQTLERLDALEPRTKELTESNRDLFATWAAWRPAYEDKLVLVENRFLQSLRDIEGATRAREESLDQGRQRLYEDFVLELERAANEIQERLWRDLEALKADQERQIHTELRLIRRKAAATVSAAPATVETDAPRPAVQPADSGFDYGRFEERFRGDEVYVSKNQEFYLPYFEGAGRVLDLGCGRGELLKLLAGRGVEAIGCDLDAEALEAARADGVRVENADLFSFLERQQDASCDGIVCAHVVEHIPPLGLPRLMELAERKLRPGGVFAIETPNPRCLAIFAGDFYLDPTHQRPVPPALLDFLLREAGFGQVETIERHPASEVHPEIASMGEVEALRGFREKFFGGLDYAIIARKIGS